MIDSLDGKGPFSKTQLASPSGANRRLPLVLHSRNIDDIRITDIPRYPYIYTLIRGNNKKKKKKQKEVARARANLLYL